MQHRVPLVRSLLVSILAASPLLAAPQYESPHVSPIAIAGDRVLVVNTPDARLSVFTIVDGTPALEREIPVGMEPVSVRALDATTAWVANHLSDDVSIVDLTLGVTRHALYVGDEPADIAFVPKPGEPGAWWAVVTLSQEDRIVVHEAAPPYTRVTALDVPGSDPRMLVPSQTGDAVWAVVFESGNRSTIVPRARKPQGPWGAFDPPVPPIVPPLNPDLPAELFPDNSVIVRKLGGSWLDEQGGNWNSVVSWDLTDADLVRISFASGAPLIDGTARGVGTLLYAAAIDPVSGELFVANTEAHNEVYFEPKLVGAAVRNNLTRVDPSSLVPTVFSLNTHVDEGTPGQPTPPSSPALRAESLAIPHGVLVSAVSGSREVYVSAIGSERVAVVNPVSGQVIRRLPVTRGGTGLAETPGQPTLLLVNRLENAIEVVDPFGGTIESVPIGASGFDPTGFRLRNGRRHLYTGAQSAHGTFACASCHAHANLDQIGWDLGDPGGELKQLDPADNGGALVAPFHPLKGPMVTQTLRGLRDAGLMHWRGDRLDFTRFNGAFASLLGGDTLSTRDIRDFEAFALSLEFPPNPLVDLHDQPPATIQGGSPATGLDVFEHAHNEFCVRCHTLPLGTSGFVAPIDTVEGLGNQPMKVAHFRNLYEKIGFTSETSPTNKLGFGYTHDGSEHDLDEFLDFFLGFFTEEELIDIRAMLLSFPTGTHGAVGQEVAITAGTLIGLPLARLQALQAEADAGKVDLVAHTLVSGEVRGFLRSAPQYQSDRAGEVWSWEDVVDHVTTEDVAFVFMAVPAGQGFRMGVDRDEDGFYDATERDAGTDPADPLSRPTVSVATAASKPVTRLLGAFPVPFSTDVTLSLYATGTTPARIDVYDLQGRRVFRLYEGSLPIGKTEIRWEGRDDAGRSVAAGWYFVRSTMGERAETMRILRVD